MEVVGTNPTLEQKIEKEISKILKNNPQTGNMEHLAFIKCLEDGLREAGFDDLDQVDILKFATLIRDPLANEINVSFETRPSKTDDMRNLAWQKIHQDAIKHLDENDLKKINILIKTLQWMMVL